MLVSWIISTLIGRYQVGDGRGLQQWLLCFPKKSTVRCGLQSQIQFNLHCDLNEKLLHKRFFIFCRILEWRDKINMIPKIKNLTLWWNFQQNRWDHPSFLRWLTNWLFLGWEKRKTFAELSEVESSYHFHNAVCFHFHHRIPDYYVCI